MPKVQAIEPGHCVAVCLMPESAPRNCYVGLVEVTDEYGIRINLVHWDDKLDMIGGYSESLFIPWFNINSILVSTETQPTRRFLVDRAPKWMKEVEAMCAVEEKAPGKKK